MYFRPLILAGAIIGLFLLLLVRTKKKRSYSDNFLIAWLLSSILQLLFYYDNLLPQPLLVKGLQILGFSLTLLSSPLLYLYIRSLAFGTKFHILKSGYHLLPYLLFNMMVFYFYVQDRNYIEVSHGILQFTGQVPNLIKDYAQFLLAIVPGIYAVLSILTLIKYQKTLPDNYSYTEKINLNWLKRIVTSLIVLFIVLYLIIKFGRNYTAITHQNLFAIVGGILAVYLLLIGFFGLRQTTVFIEGGPSSDLQKAGSLSKKGYEHSGLNEDQVQQIFYELKQHMELKKPYLDESLSLSMLARQLNVTSNQLSQVINQETGSNFFNFINAYRVEAVKLKLKDPSFSHFSILGIAYECGFRSKASFNKIFKQQVGQTPSEYQKS